MDVEEKLISLLRSGDVAAIDGLVEAHGDRLLRSAMLLCGDEFAARDFVQDTFIAAFRSGQRFRGGSSLYTWLHSILLNLVRHHRRDRIRLVFEEDLSAREEPAFEEQPASLDLDFAAAELTRALKQLSDAHREVLVLRYYEHMRIPEMAQHLGISKGTVKSRLHYAIREMQTFLPAEMNLFGAGGTKETE